MTAAEAVRPGLTMGVEEEFFLVDAVGGQPLPVADDVLRDLRTGAPPTVCGGADVKAELLACQVEAASAVCGNLAELAGRLRRARAGLAAAARRRGAVLVSCGTPPAGDGRARLSPGARFRRIADLYAGVVPDYESGGCHVHVGVRDRETAVAVIGHLRPWLPTLLALSGNSPHHHGTDSGYASWRMVQQSRFPGSGVPPPFPSAAAYDREVARLVDCGVLVDERMSFWLARPSARFPTVEFRVADAAASCGEALLQAALSRALVSTALAAVDRGLPAPAVRNQVAAAAVWSAARHGLHGPGVHPFQERSVPAVELVSALLAHTAPALAADGDLPFVRSLITWLAAHGDGAERQRRSASQGPAAVVRHLSREVLAPLPAPAPGTVTGPAVARGPEPSPTAVLGPLDPGGAR
ncbi:glutamate--cysteine ligase [Streptomyces sp. NPDC018031]|uniref:glutamate--cysteine ligase n=1 Tax=Streptomyces sp. NPDC018031 TaxID=3365033 RepID=UPI0037B01DA2